MDRKDNSLQPRCCLGPKELTLFESLHPSLTTVIVWGKNVEVMAVVKHLDRYFN